MFDEAKAAGEADKIATALDADILFYNGEITFANSNRVIDLVCGRRRRKNILLILITPGGDPDAAFKIGRAAQAQYDNVSLYVPGWCKSAGTLIALAASHIYVGDRGELGPMDIQIAKADEILEMGSGLTVGSALTSLQTTASKMFLNFLLTIRQDTGGSITTRTAAELASSMVVKLLDPIYRQIDPMKIGENSRAMSITKNYGLRLNMRSRTLKDTQSLEFLVSGYPDHGFVIDRTEARLLFNQVLEPTSEMVGLSEVLGKDGVMPLPKAENRVPRIQFLSTELAPARTKPSKPSRSAANDLQRTASAKPARKPAKKSAVGRKLNGHSGERSARPASGAS